MFFIKIPCMNILEMVGIKLLFLYIHKPKFSKMIIMLKSQSVVNIRMNSLTVLATLDRERGRLRVVHF